jgi:hypothetical protein
VDECRPRGVGDEDVGVIDLSKKALELVALREIGRNRLCTREFGRQ